MKELKVDIPEEYEDIEEILEDEISSYPDCDISTCTCYHMGICMTNNWECRVKLDNGDNGVY